MRKDSELENLIRYIDSLAGSTHGPEPNYQRAVLFLALGIDRPIGPIYTEQLGTDGVLWSLSEGGSTTQRRPQKLELSARKILEMIDSCCKELDKIMLQRT